MNTQHASSVLDFKEFEAADIDFPNISKSALALRSINHPLRQRILQIIHENEKLNVTQIYVKLRLEQSVASQHLAILRKAGIISPERDGKLIYYSINKKRITQIDQLVKDLLV